MFLGMKRFALVLLLVAACKTDDSKPAASSQETSPTAVESGGNQGARPRARPAMPDLKVPRNRVAAPDGDNAATPPTDEEQAAKAERREQRREERTQRMLQRLDENGDGKLTVDELAQAKGRMKFDDPAAVDTDKDGVISAEELNAAIKARREAHRGEGRHLRGNADGQPAEAPAPTQP